MSVIIRTFRLFAGMALLCAIVAAPLCHPDVCEAKRVATEDFINAIIGGDYNTVEEMLFQGANPNHTEGGKGGDTPLNMAIAANQPEIVELLLSLGADPNQMANVFNAVDHALLKARTAEFKGLPVRSYLRTRKNVPGPMMDLVKRALEPRSPIMTAALYCRPAIMGTLLTAGGDPDQQNLFGRTALIDAAEAGCVPTTEILLPLVIDLEVEMEDGTAALMAAASRGHTDVVKLLLYHGADPDHGINEEGGEEYATPLLKAEASGHLETVWVLRESAKLLTSE